MAARSIRQTWTASWEAGLSHIVITAGTLDEVRKALELASDDRRLFTTVGVHPTRCKELVEAGEGMAAYIDALLDLAKEGGQSGGHWRVWAGLRPAALL